MDRPTILRDLAADSLSPDTRDVGLRELDNILKPILTHANQLNWWRIGTQTILLIFALTLATAYILDPSKAAYPGSWWPVALAAGLIFTVNISWYGYQYWFQKKWPPGSSESAESERLRAFLADYRAEKRRAFKTEFEAVDAKIFTNRLAPLLLSDDQNVRALVQRPTFGTYRAPLMSSIDPITASANAVDIDVLEPEPIAALVLDVPQEQPPAKPELVKDRSFEDYSWRWLTELTDDEFLAGLEGFLDAMPSHRTSYYQIALVNGRAHLQNNDGHGALTRAVAAAAAAIKRELKCGPGLNGKQSTVWIKQLLMGDYKNVKSFFCKQHIESIS